MSEAARNLLRDWLVQRLDPSGRDWLDGQLSSLPDQPDDRALHLAFGLAPRKLGHAPLALKDRERAAAQACLPGWRPDLWSMADAGRILLLASLPPGPGFAARFQALCQSAEVGEAVALYRGLPLYPDPDSLEPQVGEGLRTNMRDVFEAIAHHNPYPRRHFDIHRWNHMVLKALFVGSRLAPIQGLDERSNPELARIMLDFAHERRAAGRPVPWEIWRCVGPFARDGALDDLNRTLVTGDATERAAAALALAASPDAAARARLLQEAMLAEAIAGGRLAWSMLQ